MPAAIAIPSIISGGTSLLTGILGARASNNAAKTQAQAAEEAARQALAAGNTAATGVEQAGATGVERMNTATGQAVAGVNAATSQAVGGVNAATGEAVAAATTGAQAGIGSVNAATAQANQTLAQTLAVQRNNLNPYQNLGTGAAAQLETLTAPGGALARDFAFDGGDLENDAGYQFQLREGQRALERSAAARGMLQGGGTLKALSRYGQGLAATTFGDAFKRAQGTFQMNRDNRFNSLKDLTTLGLRAGESANAAEGDYGGRVSTNTTNAGLFAGNSNVRLGEFVGNTVRQGAETAGQFGTRGAETAGQFGTRGAEVGAQLGLNAAGAAGQFRVGGTRQAGEYATQGANARAAGTVASANAWNRAINGVGNAASDFFTLRSMNGKPRTTKTGGR